MDAKKDYGIEFVNIDMKFSVELLAQDGEIPTVSDMFAWITRATSKQFFKFGIAYSDRTHSFTVSVTDRGGKTDEKPPCLTQHGKSVESALTKVYFLINVLGEGDLNPSRITRALDDREEELQANLLKMMGK